MMFSTYPFSTHPISSGPNERRFCFDMTLDLTASFEFKIYVGSQAGFATLPTDRLPSQPFRAVLESYSFSRDIMGSELGVFTTGTGRLVFSNADGFYDFLPRDYSIEGRPIVLRATKVDGCYNDAFPFAELTSTGWTINVDTINIDIVDHSYKLDVPMQPNLYAGTGGAEGGEDLAGKRKPLAFGPCREVKPVFLDRALLTMQSHDGPLQAVDGMRVKGVSLIKGANYSSYSALIAATIPAGEFATCNAGGYQRLGFLAPEFYDAVTADVQGDNRDGYITTHADVCRWALGNRTVLVDPDDLYEPSFATTNAAQPAPIAYWLGPDDTVTVQSFITNIMSGCGGWGGHRRDKKFEVRLFQAPAGAPLQSFQRSHMLGGEIQREPLPSAYRPPPWRWRVTHSRCWTVQTDLAGSVGASHKAFVAEPYRIAEASRAAIKVDHPFAQDNEPKQSFFAAAADAQAFALSLINLFRTTRALYRWTTSRRALRLNLGDVVEVSHPRFDLSEGRLLTVVKIGEVIEVGSADTLDSVEVVAYG